MARKDKDKKREAEEPSEERVPRETERGAKPTEEEKPKEQKEASGLKAVVKVAEETKIEQDHNAGVKKLEFKGGLQVTNPSSADRLWDINVVLKNIESTNLESAEIQVRELGTAEDDKTFTQEFALKGEAGKSPLLVKEYISSLLNAEEVLSNSAIEEDLTKVKEKAGKPEEEKKEGEEKPSLESFGISLNKVNVVHFVIAVQNQFEKPVTELKLTKNLSDSFQSVAVKEQSVGTANKEKAQIVWTIDSLEPNTTAYLKVTAEVNPTTLDAIRSGTIEGTYKAASSFTGGLSLEKFSGMTRNKITVDMVELEDEPDTWDCKLVFDNPSEFGVQLTDADVHPLKDEGTKFVTLDANALPAVDAGSKWESASWKYKTETYPSFSKRVDFTVNADFMTEVNGAISLEDVDLVLASITGTVSYELVEAPPGVPQEEGAIVIPSFKNTDILATLKYENNGSAPLNEVTILQQKFTPEFKPPKKEEISLFLDGEKLDVSPESITVDGDKVEVVLKDLKDTPKGLFNPKSVIELKYPIHCENPVKDAKFDSDVLYKGNTYPVSQEIEFQPKPEEIPIIKVVHIRRKFHLGKDIAPEGPKGTYKITLILENIGNMPFANFEVKDKIPDNFDTSDFSVEPETATEKGEQVIKWKVESLKESEKMEFSYILKGKGDYNPSEAQVAL